MLSIEAATVLTNCQMNLCVTDWPEDTGYLFTMATTLTD